MPIIDDKTTSRLYPKPHASNLLSDDVARIRTAFDSIDTDITSLQTQISNLGVGGAMNAVVPIGSVLDYYGDVVASGFLELDGTTYSKTTYADLWAWAVANSKTTTNTSLTNLFVDLQNGNFNVPNTKGYFYRHLDATNTIDTNGTGRTVGSIQQDAFKSHSHPIASPNGLGLQVGITGPDTGSYYSFNDNVLQSTQIFSATAVGGTETRGKNIAVRKIIRATNSTSTSYTVAGTGPITTSIDILNKILTVGIDQSALKTGYKNFLINGDMSIAQRNTSFTNPATGAYTLDRWQASQLEPGCTKIISQTPCIPGELEGIPGATGAFWSRHQCTVAGTGGVGTNNDFTQRIEDVTKLSGKTVTVSFVAKAAVAKTLAIWISSYCGIGGSGDFASVTQNIAIGTALAKYSLTFTVPSISGKTIAGNNHQTYLVFRFPLNQTFDIYIKDVQLEIGSIATPFEIRPSALELTMCQRYYEKSYDTNVNPGTVINTSNCLGYMTILSGANNFSSSVYYKVCKRVAASVIFYNPNIASNNQAYNFNTSTACSSTAIGNSGQSGFSVNAVTPSNTGVNNLILVHWAANSEL